MAKKPKTSGRRKSSKPKSPAKRAAAMARTPRKTPQQRRAAANDNEMLNVVIGVMVLIMVALGVYYYQLSSHETVAASNPLVTMGKN
jgi:hypothetical protein